MRRCEKVELADGKLEKLASGAKALLHFSATFGTTKVVP